MFEKRRTKKLEKLFEGNLLRPILYGEKYHENGIKKLKKILEGKKDLSQEDMHILKRELKGRIKQFAENAIGSAPEHFGEIVGLFEKYDKKHGTSILAEAFKDYIGQYLPEYFDKQLKENFDSFTITCKQVIGHVPKSQMPEIFSAYTSCLSKLCFTVPKSDTNDINNRLEALKYCLDSASMQYDYFKTIDKKELLYPMIEEVLENLSTDPGTLDQFLNEFPKDVAEEFLNERAMEVAATNKNPATIKYLIEKGVKPCEIEGLETSNEIKTSIEEYSKLYDEAQKLSENMKTEKDLTDTKDREV